MPSQEAIEQARKHIEEGLRAIDLARQEARTLRTAGAVKLAEQREREAREIEQELVRLRAVVGK